MVKYSSLLKLSPPMKLIDFKWRRSINGSCSCSSPKIASLVEECVPAVFCIFSSLLERQKNILYVIPFMLFTIRKLGRRRSHHNIEWMIDKRFEKIKEIPLCADSTKYFLYQMSSSVLLVSFFFLVFVFGNAAAKEDKKEGKNRD